ncbi:MAG: DUF5667 domain-containing protein [Patescibacteria group bacterium]
MSKEIRQLKKLKDVSPSLEWQQKQWEVLRAQLPKVEARELSIWEKISCTMSHPSVFRPVANMFAVVVVAIVGSFSMVASAEETTHGDVLYPVKQVLEKASVVLTVNDSARVEKQTELAGKRVDELKSLAIRFELSEGNEQSVNRTVRDLKRDIEAAKASFAAVKESGDKEAIIEVATKVEQDTTKLVQEIEKVARVLPTEVQVSMEEEIREVAAVVESTNEEAFEVIVGGGIFDTTVSEDDIAQKLDDRVRMAQEQFAERNIAGWVAAATEVEEGQSEALENLQSQYDETVAEIEVLFGEKDYMGVLAAIADIKDITKTVDDVMTAEVVEGEEEIVDESVEEEEVDEIIETEKEEEVAEAEDASTSTPPENL